MPIIQKVIQFGWDTLQLVFAWLILGSFAFSSLHEVRIPLAVVIGLQITTALIIILVLRFGFRKNSAVCTSVLHGVVDPIIGCFIVVIVSLTRLPSMLKGGYAQDPASSADHDMTRIMHYVVMILPATLRFMQNKGKMTWRSFTFICIYFLTSGIEIVTLFMLAADHNAYIEVIHPAVYVPAIFTLIGCLYVTMFPLYIANSNTIDRDQHGRRLRHLVVLTGTLFLDIVFLGLHARISSIGGMKINVLSIFHYFFFFKDCFMILVTLLAVTIVLCLKYVHCNCDFQDKKKDAILQFFYGPPHRAMAAKTHAGAIIEEESRALAEQGRKALHGREENKRREETKMRELNHLDERWHPNEVEELM